MKIGTGELLLILILALLVLGPEKMPVYAKKVGKALNALKGYTSQLTEDISENILEPLEEVQKPLRKATDPLKNIAKDITQPMEEVRSSICDMGKPNGKKAEEEEAVSLPLENEQEVTSIM